MPRLLELSEFVQAGVHFGHQLSKGCPKMYPYIYGHKDGVHLIDVSKTAYLLEQAGNFLKDIVAQNKTIIFIGTKKSAQKSIQELAHSTNSPYIAHRFIGGTFTNFSQVKKAITKLLHAQDILAKSQDSHYTKKELNRMQKGINRLEANIGGIVSLRFPIGAVVIVDVKKEYSALKEATSMGIPVVGIVDTNSDPSLVDYVIPANDDSIKSVSFIMAQLGEYVQEGKQQAAQNRIQHAEAAAQEQATQDAAMANVLQEDDSEEDIAKKEQAKERRLKEAIKAKKIPVSQGRRPAARRAN